MRRRGAETSDLGTLSYPFAIVLPRQQWFGRPTGLGFEFARAQHGFSGTADNDSYRFHGAFDFFALSIGHSVARRANIGLRLSSGSVASPVAIPTTNIGTLLTGLEEVGLSLRENRVQVESLLLLGRSNFRVQTGYGFGNTDLLLSNGRNSVVLPADVSGFNTTIEVQHHLTRYQNLTFTASMSRLSGANRVVLNNVTDLGPTSASLGQKQVSVFWRHHRKRRALAVGFEYNAGAGGSNAGAVLGPLSPGSFVAATQTATLRGQTSWGSTMLKVGYIAAAAPNLEYRVGLQFGAGKASASLTEETRALFGLLDSRTEETFDQKSTRLLIPSLGLVFKPRGFRLSLQVGQVLPVSQPSRRPTAPGPPSGPPTPSSKTRGGTMASVSMQVPW